MEAGGDVILCVSGHGLLGQPHRYRAYAVPIMAVAALAWVWSLAGALALYPTESNLRMVLTGLWRPRRPIMTSAIMIGIPMTAMQSR